MSKSIWIGAVLATVVVLGGIAYLQYGRQPTVEQSVPAAVESSQTVPSDHPVAPPQEAIATADPANAAVSANDKAVQGDLESLFGSALRSWLWPDRIISRIVATIDSLDGQEPMPQHLRPLRNVEGQLIVDVAQDGSITLSPDNAKRYSTYVEVLSRVDAKRGADFYLRYQALFQKAHEELGYRGQSFNDRLLQTIDHLLATPDVAAPIKLVRPHVLYEFDDGHLERLSFGQKTMIRMGNKNAAAVKAKLREIRAALVAAR